MKIFVILGATFGLLGVITGAFGAHALEDRVTPDMLDIWETGVRYQMYHALALFGAAWLYQQTEAVTAVVAGWTFAAGIVVFSGSLYILVLSGIRGLGAITPIGGLALIVGWLCCILSALKLESIS